MNAFVDHGLSNEKAPLLIFYKIIEWLSVTLDNI